MFTKNCGGFRKNQAIWWRLKTLVKQKRFSQRSHAVVEPRISTQWFLKMEKLAQKPALDAVLNAEISKFTPAYTVLLNTYRHWLENVKDLVSADNCGGDRQIQPGMHPLMAIWLWRLPDKKLGNFLLYKSLNINEIRPGWKDVLTPGFPSWLWPTCIQRHYYWSGQQGCTVLPSHFSIGKPVGISFFGLPDGRPVLNMKRKSFWTCIFYRNGTRPSGKKNVQIFGQLTWFARIDW